MKIDEACINHNAVRLIKEVTDASWEYLEDKDKNGILINQGFVNGITTFAEELKKVLKQ